MSSHPGPFPHDPASPASAIEAEVRANILAQPLIDDRPAAGTAADLNLPDALVSRIADRIIRSTFEERHRSIRQDQPAPSHREPPPARRESWPALRGWRADGHLNAHPSDDSPLAPVADHISLRLATDGIPRTLADILRDHLRTFDAPQIPSALLSAGFPVDLLDFFSVDGRPLLDQLIATRDSQENIHAVAARAVYAFTPSAPGFRAIDDAGSQPSSSFRLQLTRGDHWDAARSGPKSGDNLDLTIRLINAAPDARFSISIEQSHASTLRRSLAAVGIDTSGLVITEAELPVSQWAQDNLKPGLLPDQRPAAILPRYASRAEDGARFDPGDTAAMAHIADADVATFRSPLHFQGGNIMFVRRPDSTSLLLIGEAEIARNVTLGLTPQQAIDSFRAEFGADAAMVLPAVGFHLDTEISFRCVGDAAIAFVPDEPAAARLIIAAAIRTLESRNILSRADSKILRTFLDHKNDEQLVARLAPMLARFSDPHGNLAESFAAIFSLAPFDSGPANAQRVLFSLDLLASLKPRPWESSLHPHAQAYMRALRRSAADRDAMHRALADAGFRLVPVPSISAGTRSASVINALQLPDRMLIPVRGGFLSPLDDAAIKVLRTHLPSSVQVILIPAAESERRGGALHCSIAAFPDAGR